MRPPRDDLLVSGGRYLDVVAGEWRDGDVRILDGRIVEVGPHLGSSPGVETLDASGHYVLPGLIDCHVHVTAVTADLTLLPELSPTYVALGTARIIAAMLRRGFTTVRDVGGADYGIHEAQGKGWSVARRSSSAGRRSRRPAATGTPARGDRSPTSTTRPGPGSAAWPTGSWRCGRPPATSSGRVLTTSSSWPAAASPRRPTGSTRRSTPSRRSRRSSRRPTRRTAT